MPTGSLDQTDPGDENTATAQPPESEPATPTPAEPVEADNSEQTPDPELLEANPQVIDPAISGEDPDVRLSRGLDELIEQPKETEIIPGYFPAFELDWTQARAVAKQVNEFALTLGAKVIHDDYKQVFSILVPETAGDFDPSTWPRFVQDLFVHK